MTENRLPVRRRRIPMRLATRHVLVSLAAVVLAVATAATAAAAPARAANLCSTGKTVLRSLATAPSASTLSAAQARASLKTNIGKIVSAKSTLVGAAPSSLKNSVRNVIAFYAVLRSDLGSVGWNYTALATNPAKLKSLEAAALKAAVSFRRIERYAHKTCHV
jgi:hypothetical protein